MGADFAGDDEAIEEIKRLSPRALEWIHHHLGNSLTSVVGNIELKKYGHAKRDANHAVADLKKIRGGKQWRR